MQGRPPEGGGITGRKCSITYINPSKDEHSCTGSVINIGRLKLPQGKYRSSGRPGERITSSSRACSPTGQSDAGERFSPQAPPGAGIAASGGLTGAGKTSGIARNQIARHAFRHNRDRGEKRDPPQPSGRLQAGRPIRRAVPHPLVPAEIPGPTPYRQSRTQGLMAHPADHLHASRESVSHDRQGEHQGAHRENSTIWLGDHGNDETLQTVTLRRARSLYHRGR